MPIVRWLFATVLAVAGCAPMEGPSGAGAPQVTAMTVDQAALRPGLLPRSFYVDFEHVDRMPVAAADLAKGTLGAPVANLAASNSAGKLWDAQAATIYGVHFTGAVRLRAGETQFA
jgi:hypothetical protein